MIEHMVHVSGMVHTQTGAVRERIADDDDMKKWDATWQPFEARVPKRWTQSSTTNEAARIATYMSEHWSNTNQAAISAGIALYIVATLEEDARLTRVAQGFELPR